MALDSFPCDWLMDFDFDLTAKSAKLYAKDTKFYIKNISPIDNRFFSLKSNYNSNYNLTSTI